MANTVYFPAGVTSEVSGSPLEAFPFLNPITWMVYFNDMTVLPTTLGWTNTNTNGALAVAGTLGCGVCTQTCAGADNDLSQLYMTTATMGITAGKPLLFEAKVKVDKGAGGTIGQQEIFVGLAAAQTGANFTAADGLTMTVDDAIGFWSVDGTANIGCIIRATDVESIQTAATTYVDATYMVLNIYYDGTSVFFYKDGAKIATLTSPTTAALAPTLYIKAGEGFASVLTTDYVFVARRR